MTGAIFIGGGGGKEDAVELDAAYKNKVLSSSKSPSCLYIPHAMESGKHSKALHWFTETYDFFEDIKLLQAPKDLEDEYDSIYMGGGYCHRLRDTLISFDVHSAFFKSFIGKGGSLYGGSAGGVVLGKTLLSSREVMLRPETFLPLDHQGMDICNGLSFRPHFTGSKDEALAIESLSREQEIAVIALSEGAGVIIQEGQGHELINPDLALEFGVDL